MTTADPLQTLASERGLCSQWDMLSGRALADAVARDLGLPRVDPLAVQIAPPALAALPADFVWAHGVLPVALADGTLTLAVGDPLDLDLLDRAAYVSGLEVRAALALPEEITEAIGRHYGDAPDALTVVLAREAESRGPDLPAAEEPETDQAAPVLELVQRILEEAVRRRASDIHVEPLPRQPRVRYRVDGVLQEGPVIPRGLLAAVISRLKIMADISIAEKRLPQDGRFRFAAGGRRLDLRVASLPTIHGESIVMRLLDQESLGRGLAELGLLPGPRLDLEQQLGAADGMILVTGPTGSGKTSTLYAALRHLNDADRKIITVEDPIEYQIPGINQVPVVAATGMTFAAALRAILRQAPNIVMVGEIRDRETAEIALQASLTGHLVFSTLHTNDAASAVVRLIDLGVQPFLVAAALRSVVAQRLVRRICPACRRSHTPSARELQALGLPELPREGADFARGAGCAACHGTGYQGRFGLFEILPLSEQLKGMIYERVTSGRLLAQARAEGMQGLREDGIRKVLAGLTTIEEVVSATVGDPL